MATGREGSPNLFKENTIFACRFGIFQFVLIDFRLMSSRSTLETMMDTTFSDLSFVRGNLEGEGILSDNIEEHKNHLRQVLDGIDSPNLNVKIEKYAFCGE